VEKSGCESQFAATPGLCPWLWRLIVLVENAEVGKRADQLHESLGGGRAKRPVPAVLR
jgi:hypothetical protein